MKKKKKKKKLRPLLSPLEKKKTEISMPSSKTPVHRGRKKKCRRIFRAFLFVWFFPLSFSFLACTLFFFFFFFNFTDLKVATFPFVFQGGEHWLIVPAISILFFFSTTHWFLWFIHFLFSSFLFCSFLFLFFFSYLSFLFSVE